VRRGKLDFTRTPLTGGEGLADFHLEEKKKKKFKRRNLSFGRGRDLHIIYRERKGDKRGGFSILQGG